MIFIHIPKTGGSSIRRALEDQDSRGHWSLSMWEENTKGRYVAEEFICTFVRNPWERIHSWWRHQRMFKQMSFSYYILHCAFEEVFTEGPRSDGKVLGCRSAWQEDWITSFYGNQVDFIGRFENLQNDFNFLCCGELEQSPFQLSHEKLNKDRDKYPYSEDLWSQAMQDVMAPAFVPFGQKYGYSPPEPLV